MAVKGCGTGQNRWQGKLEWWERTGGWEKVKKGRIVGVVVRRCRCIARAYSLCRSAQDFVALYTSVHVLCTSDTDPICIAMLLAIQCMLT